MTATPDMPDGLHEGCNYYAGTVTTVAEMDDQIVAARDVIYRVTPYPYDVSESLARQVVNAIRAVPNEHEETERLRSILKDLHKHGCIRYIPGHVSEAIARRARDAVEGWNERAGIDGDSIVIDEQWSER